MSDGKQADGIPIVVWSPTLRLSWVELDSDRAKLFTEEAMQFAWESEQLKAVIDYEI